MSIQINNINLSIDDDMSIIKNKAAKTLRVLPEDIKELKILKESIDARKKDKINFNYQVLVSLGQNKKKDEKLVERLRSKDVLLYEIKEEENLIFGNKKLNHRPIVIGMGPCGMFAALLLAEKGYRPLVIERGEDVDNRTKTVHEFFKGGPLNTNSNVQFGEGGAGTFSDGKLTTRIKDTRCGYVLDRFVSFGAPSEIIYMGKPHIGTDILKGVVKNLRKRIIDLGGEVIFNETLEDIITSNGKLTGIKVSGKEIPCEALILAVGHSSRDTYEMLFNKGIKMEAKPFAIGVRAEHLQSFIDENQYGKFAGHKRLKAADYRLTHTAKNGRGVYSFCMCPGGFVVPASSEENRLVVNGMSNYNRDGKNANSAIVVSVGPEDFEGSSPLSGMEFQRHYEGLCYKEGKDYKAPVQLLQDFINGRTSKGFNKVTPTYERGVVLGDIRRCLPPYVVEALKEGFISFDRKIKGYAGEDALLTGIETRTSAPLRIERNEKIQSVSLEGFYPAGEGAGFAGGIISAAVDGIKAAESIMKEYKPIH